MQSANSVQGGIGNVIRHYKSKNYREAGQSLAQTDRKDLEVDLKDKAVKKELKSLGVTPPAGCFGSKPYTVPMVQAKFGELIDAQLKDEAAGLPQFPAPVQYADAPSAPPRRVDALRGQLVTNQAYNDGIIERMRDDAAEQFEETTVYNQLNEQQLHNAIQKEQETLRNTQISADQRAIHESAMRAQMNRLQQLQSQLAGLNIDAAGSR